MKKTFSRLRQLPVIRRLTSPVLIGLGVGLCLVFWPFIAPRTPVVSMPGASLEGNLLAAGFAHDRKDLQATALFFQKAHDRAPDNPLVTSRLLEAYLVTGDFRQAPALAALKLKAMPQDPQARLMQSLSHFKSGDYEQALTEVGKAGDDPFAGVIKLLVSMWSRYGQGDIEAAKTYARELTEQTPVGFLANWSAGRLHEAVGDIENAIIYYELAAQLDGGRSHAFLADNTGFLTNHGRREIARHILHGSFAEQRRFPLVARAFSYLDAPPLRAVPTPQQGLALDLLELGTLFSSDLPSRTTLPYLHQALWLNPALDRAHLLIGSLRSKDGYLDDALQQYRAIGSGSIHYRIAQISIAEVLEKKGEIKRAGKMFEDLAGAEQQPHLRKLLGDFYRRHERFAEAEAIYTGLIDELDTVSPAHWNLFFFRGIARERQHGWQQAESDLLRARNLSNDQPFVLNYLGYSWIDNGVNLPEALKMIKKAVEQEPRNGFFVDSLGWAFYRLAQYRTAVRFLEKATELEPDDPEIIDHLGDALWQTGRHFEARYQWLRALGLEDEESKKPAIQEKLDHGLTKPPVTSGPSI